MELPLFQYQNAVPDQVDIGRRACLAEIQKQLLIRHLNLKYLGLTAATAHISVIDIAPDGTHYGHYSFEPTDNVNITNVTGMPYLIAVLEMGGVTVIPA